jgi:protoporphyrinogen oxidase
MTKKKIAVIIGAGPAGLTAAYDLLQKTDIKPIVFEATDAIGGIAKSISYNGNIFDFGPHRYFSKSERVMKWLFNIFPLQGALSKDDRILKREIPLSHDLNAPHPDESDNVMLTRHRLSRIYYLRSFFDYPISLSISTIRNLGLFRTFKIALSYFKSCIFQIKPEKSLEDFIINRFGYELYRTFFRDYTKKVWGISPAEIKPDWGAQRIRGISIRTVLIHGFKKLFFKDQSFKKKDETSLIEWFFYPKKGSGQLWEEVAGRIVREGGDIYKNHEVIGLVSNDTAIRHVLVRDRTHGVIKKIEADYVISSMPIKDIISALGDCVPPAVRRIAQGLCYRDGIIVCVGVKKMQLENTTTFPTVNNIVPDVWIYIQDNDVMMGRVQIYNNWSPYILKDDNLVWMAAEYFCNEHDALWSLSQDDMINFAIRELVQVGLISHDAVVDVTMHKIQKTYPAYFGTYDSFSELKEFTDTFHNLFLIGRNGMHRYNNMDHSMLTGMVAVDAIVENSTDKERIWSINTDIDYHEEK